MKIAFSSLGILLCILIVLLAFRTFNEDNQFLLGGIQVNEPDHQIWVNTLDEIGMNTVSVTVYAKQGDWNSDNFWYDEKSDWVISEIKAAKEKGLKVVLILRVALDHAYERNKFLWHGMIMPKNDTLLKSWFEKYESFTNKWSIIAEQLDVDVLAIGSELRLLTATFPIDSIPNLEAYYLDTMQQNKYKRETLQFKDEILTKHLWARGYDNMNSLEEYLEAKLAKYEYWAKQVSYNKDIDKINLRRKTILNYWGKVITVAKKHFHGKLTYAANFDNYNKVAFWPLLDMMGINAYYKLRNIEDSDKNLYETLYENWELIFSEIDTFKTKNNIKEMPVIFTEMGYTKRKNCTLEPWAADGFSVIEGKTENKLMVWKEQSSDTKERTLAVKALGQLYKEKKIKLHGILYWKLSTVSSHENIEPFLLNISEDARGKDELLDALLSFVNKE